MTPILEIERVSFAATSDWTRRRVPVLRDISLSVTAGESFGFLGHNGAGKTTTIKCILDLLRPQAGVIRLFGKSSREAGARSRVGFLAEQPYYYENLSVGETLEFFAKIGGLHGRELKQEVARVTERLGLESRLSQRMRALSKGITQRVGLAQAMLRKPDLLILDEPFSGLDPIGRKEFRDIFLALKAEGVTIFISSHVLSDIELLCDRVTVLVKGECRGIFSIGDLPVTSERVVEIVVMRDDAAHTWVGRVIGFREDVKISQSKNCISVVAPSQRVGMELLSEAVASGCTVRSFQEHGGTLEDLFVSLVKG